MKKLRIAIVTQYYEPDPPSWIPTGLARELADRGHSVRVLTTFPHYATGRVAEGFRQRLVHVENDGGIGVRRVPIVPSHSSNPLGRIANYLSFAVSARLAGSFLRDADAIYAYSTPMTAAEPARAIARRYGVPLIVHVQDVWPESVTGSGLLPGRLNQLADSLISRWLIRVYRGAAYVLAIAPSMRELLVARGVPPTRCEVVLNWSNEADTPTDLRPDRTSMSPDAGLTVVYAGNLGSMQDLDTVIRAASTVRDLPGFKLKIAGSGVLEGELRALAQRLDAQTIQFVGRLSPSEMSTLYAEADFQVVSLKDLDVFAGTIPSKLQAGLANALPAISTVRGDVAAMVESGGLGFVAAPEDVDSLADAFRLAYATSPADRDEMSRRARAFYDDHMSRSNAVDQIEQLILRSVESSSAAKEWKE